MKAKEHDSLVVDVEHNRFYWNSKGITWGNVIDFFKVYFGVDFEAARKLVLNTSKSMSQPLRTGENKKQEWESVDLNVSTIHHNRLRDNDYEWWLGRGVLPETVKYLKLGTMTDMMGVKWYTIPIMSIDGNRYDNYKLRRAGEGLPRYRQYKPNLRPALYNPYPTQVARSNQVVLVAGEIKAIVLSQYGIPTVSSSTGVNTWQDEWVPVFKGKEVIICFDPKEHLIGPGKESSAKSITHSLYSSDLMVQETPLPYDPDDCIVKHGWSPMEVSEKLNIRKENIWTTSMDTWHSSRR